VEAAGSTMDRVLKCQAFLTEQSDFAAFNEIYKGYFPTDPPARSTVIVKDLVLPGAKIEVDCFAYTD
jgi:enamine deaminase RidA (YjgF/YER057c/UK114 family)